MTAHRFLDPALLARIGDLELVARTVVDGFISGLHRSSYLGRSVDFAEHRPYMPGDDIRRIDWRVFGRSDRFYVKEFEADTNANFTIVLDVSRSMAYGSGALTKLDYARFLAASLAWFARRQRDRVGLMTFDSVLRAVIPPSAKHLEVILHTLDTLEPGGAGALETPLERVAELLRRRSVVLLISDLYDEPEAVTRSVSRLAAGGNDVMVFQVLDPYERTFPFEEPADFEDLETGERLPVVPGEQRAEYVALLEGHLSSVGRSLVAAGVDYVLFETSRPLDFALFEFLTRRQRLSRVR
ncbi:MAG TPA: DUF58 domain-containing protein [Gemmatimonadales bacterium]|nr:DUF58 domain-containing protein [Gemmatimonadales bacterium]